MSDLVITELGEERAEVEVQFGSDQISASTPTGRKLGEKLLAGPWDERTIMAIVWDDNRGTWRVSYE